MSKLTPELVDNINAYMDEGYSQRAACKSVGVPESTYRSWRDRGKLEEFDKPIAAGTTVRPHKKRKTLKGKRYVLTSAQNNTYVHDKFLSSLETYCSFNNAELIVGTFNYNKNGFQNGANEDIWFDPRIRQYIMDESANIFEGLVWCGELNILPTAVNPISGLETYTKEDSGIIPHVKVRLQSIATAKHDPCKMMYTTGTVTKANYIQQKSGQKAEFHHTYGALVAEVDDDGDWFVRQLIADSSTGEFYDLTQLATPNGVYDGNRVEAINYGDIHAEKPDELVSETTFGEGGMLDTLKPLYQFSNDTSDFTTRNHHNIKDPYFRYKLQVRDEGKDLVEDDIKKAVNVLKSMSRDWCQTVVVESNHDLALLKWLKESEPKHDHIWNAIFYHKCQSRVLQAIADKDEDFSIFEWCCKELGLDLNVKFLKEDESFVICEERGGGIECGNHGHLGANGSRGSVLSYAKLGKRQNIGHGHSATILDSVYMAGIKGSLEQGYNKGASSWSHSDIITYKNGKRCIVTLKSGKWRA